MNVVFMGTPEFAVHSLRALVESGYRVETVVTQPDRPGGRGKKMRPPAVKTFALEQGLRVCQPEKVREPEFVRYLGSLQPDVVVVAAFGRILPGEILTLPRYGCINVHASLLPAYRGAAPIHRAVINGERETGITIMQMDAGLDTGDIIIQKSLPIGPDVTAGEVHDRLAEMGGRLLVQALELIEAGRAERVPQDDARSSYAPVLTRDDEIIDWSRDAAAIKNLVRGLNPWPGARTAWNGRVLKVWRVQLVQKPGPTFTGALPGQVVRFGADCGIIVQTGRGLLSVDELQLQGKKRLGAFEFIKGNPLKPGTVLGG